MNRRQTIPIPEMLKPYIRQVWSMDFSDEENTPRCFPVFADGYPGIIFYQSDQGMFLNQEKKLSPVFIFGQTVEPIKMNASGSLRMIIFTFHPHVMPPIFRFNAKELTDDCIDLTLLPAIPRINLAEQLWNTVSAEKQIGIMFGCMQKLIEKNNTEPDKGMHFATSQIIRSNGIIRLKELHRLLNLSERTFERRFEQYVGIPPKLFAGISQFQASLNQMRNKEFFKLSDIAYDNGYADQSHFIRIFKKFTGLSPLEFYRQSHNLIQDLPVLIN